MDKYNCRWRKFDWVNTKDWTSLWSGRRTDWEQNVKLVVPSWAKELRDARDEIKVHVWSWSSDTDSLALGRPPIASLTIIFFSDVCTQIQELRATSGVRTSFKALSFYLLTNQLIKVNLQNVNFDYYLKKKVLRLYDRLSGNKSTNLSHNK